MSAPLRVVAPQPVIEASLPAIAASSVGERVRQLQVEAQRLARQHVEALQAALVATQRLADEIATGGEAYPAGVRDIARRLAEDNAARATTLETLMVRLQAPQG
ncbi:hypothetical protein [Phenylobacterium sp.]|uniref:hypothetical protein n=1 Tax=Phenylobacterium sp. TaxID=1871053 RepID=UPI0035B4E14D